MSLNHFAKDLESANIDFLQYYWKLEASLELEEKKQQDKSFNQQPLGETQLIESVGNELEEWQQQFEEENPSIQWSNSNQHEKIQTEENTFITTISIEPECLQWLRQFFPKQMNLVNLKDLRTFFQKITATQIKQHYPKYFFFYCKLLIRPSWINKMLNYIFENKYKNWDNICDFHQPIKWEKIQGYSIENLIKVNGLNKCPKDNVLRSKLGEFHTLCSNNIIVGKIDRLMNFQVFRSRINLITQQCKEEKITDSDLLTHIKALEEFASIVEKLKQNTIQQKTPKMKKTIDIDTYDIQELFSNPELDVYLYTILTQIADIINMDNIQQDDKQKWTDFQELVLTIFKKDPNKKKSSRQNKKNQKQEKLVQKSIVDQFVDACLEGDSVPHSIISIDN